MKLSSGRSSDFRHDDSASDGPKRVVGESPPSRGAQAGLHPVVSAGSCPRREIACAGHSGGTAGELHPTSLFAPSTRKALRPRPMPRHPSRPLSCKGTMATVAPRPVSVREANRPAARPATQRRTWRPEFCAASRRVRSPPAPSETQWMATCRVSFSPGRPNNLKLSRITAPAMALAPASTSAL